MPADVPEHFRGTVSIWATVTSSDGSKQVTFDDSTPVQKQLIDIKYTKDTRKQFKPGLPYKGKVRQWDTEGWLILSYVNNLSICAASGADTSAELYLFGIANNVK